MTSTITVHNADKFVIGPIERLAVKDAKGNDAFVYARCIEVRQTDAPPLRIELLGVEPANLQFGVYKEPDHPANATPKLITDL